MTLDRLMEQTAARILTLSVGPYPWDPATDEIPNPNSTIGPVSYGAAPKPLDSQPIFEGTRGARLWKKLKESADLPDGPYELLGKGTRGTAYGVDDARVLKITNDQSEAIGAALVRDTPDPRGNAQRIHGVWHLQSRTQAWAIVQERLEPLDEEDPWRELSNLWPKWSRVNDYSPIIPENVNRFFEDSEDSDVVQNDSEAWSEFKQWFSELAEYFESIGLLYHDFWYRNMLMRGNHHVAIDFGYSVSVADDDPNIEVISRYRKALAKRVVAANINRTLDDKTFGADIWLALCRRISHDPSTTLHSFNSGTQGRLFKLDDDRVLKVTGDVNEAQAAFRVMKKPDVTVFKCFDVFELPTEERYGPYGIVMERLKPMTDARWIEFLDLVWTFYNDEQYSLMSYSAETFWRFRKWLDEREEEGPSSKWKTQLDWLVRLSKYLRGLGVKISTSEFIDNAMQRLNGEPVAADLGYGEIAGKEDKLERVGQATANETDDAIALSDYPEGFSLEQLKSMPSNRAVKYAAQHLTRLGKGSARVAFAIDETKVLKVALNEKGIDQNRTEADVQNLYDCVAKIFDADFDGYTWIEAERARKARADDFKRYFGITFKQLKEILFYEDRRRRQNVGPPPNFFNQDDAKVGAIIDMMVNYDMPVGDLTRPSSWGVVKRTDGEIPILIDYGLTRDVYNKHYKPKPSQSPWY